MVSLYKRTNKTNYTFWINLADSTRKKTSLHCKNCDILKLLPSNDVFFKIASLGSYLASFTLHLLSDNAGEALDEKKIRIFLQKQQLAQTVGHYRLFSSFLNHGRHSSWFPPKIFGFLLNFPTKAATGTSSGALSAFFLLISQPWRPLFDLNLTSV